MPVWYPGFGRSLGGGHDNSLQYSCLVNSRDRRAWRATVHRVTQSWTWQKRLSKYVCMICTYLLKQKWLMNSFTNTLNSPFVLGIICILFLIVDCTPQHVGPYFPDQGSNPRPLHWKAGPKPLDLRGTPSTISKTVHTNGVWLKTISLL